MTTPFGAILRELKAFRHLRELVRLMRAGQVLVHDGTLYVPQMKFGWRGEWADQVRCHLTGHVTPLGRRPNTGTYQGWDHALMNEYKGGPKSTAWYIAIGSGQTPPLVTWTGADYPANASELVSEYQEANRPAWVPADASNGVMGTDTRSVFTAAAGGMTVWNNGLLNSQVKADAAGGVILASATLRPSAAVISENDAYETGFRVSLVDNSP